MVVRPLPATSRLPTVLSPLEVVPPPPPPSLAAFLPVLPRASGLPPEAQPAVPPLHLPDLPALLDLPALPLVPVPVPVPLLPQPVVLVLSAFPPLPVFSVSPVPSPLSSKAVASD